MTNGNANYFPWEETKEDNIFPTMIGHFRIKSMEDGQSNNSGKRMFRATFECVAPLDYAGQQHFENYVVGSDDAPMAVLPGSFGTRNFKKLCKSAQIPPNNDVAVLMRSCEGAEVLLSVVEYEETQEGQYKGSKKNRIAGYFRLGEREIGVAPAQGVAGRSTGPAPAMPAAPAAPAYQPPPVQTQAPAPQYAPPAGPPAPVQPQAPMAPPAPPQAPATPQAGGMMLRCSICNNEVPATEFGMHVARHQSDPGWNGIG
jgi:hypothetical protein